jgi:outer membrane protein assembly factor BamB
LSAGTLEELFQAAIVFSGPALEDTYRTADTSSRIILGLTLNDLLFSWSGKEFAAFGMEGRPHPVYAIQITNERKRQEVFDKAFKSIALNENVRLNLDGVRIPRIEVPEFLQSLLRRWNLFLPSPYYTVYKDYLLVSESAETLLSALRAMQRNDVLPKTAAWRNIAGGRNASSAFSLYYSLDLSMPFFLRKSTPLSGFIALYRQGLARMSFDRGLADISLVLVPGSGSGVTLVNTLAIETKGRPSNRIYGAGKGNNSRIFISAGDSVISVNPSDDTVKEFSGQGPFWVVPVDGVSSTHNECAAWIVNDRGRVILVNGDLEPANGFPVLTGLRVSSAPVSFGGKLYLCDEDGKVHTVDSNGTQTVWETSFTAPLRSPPSFLAVSGRNARSYAAVYPKSFFGEVWLLDADGKALPKWPAALSTDYDDEGSESGEWGDDYAAPLRSTAGGTGIGFGSPVVFSHNGRVRVAFVSQDGELFIYDDGAALVSPFPLYLNGVFYIQPVYDGDYLWLVSSEGTLFRVGLEGELLYQKIPGFSVKEEGNIAVFDYDGDKSPEIFITGEGNTMYAFTRNFRSLEGFPLAMWGTPYFVSAQGNKKAGIYGMGMDRRLYFWQFK